MNPALAHQATPSPESPAEALRPEQLAEWATGCALPRGRWTAFAPQTRERLEAVLDALAELDAPADPPRTEPPRADPAVNDDRTPQHVRKRLIKRAVADWRESRAQALAEWQESQAHAEALVEDVHRDGLARRVGEQLSRPEHAIHERLHAIRRGELLPSLCVCKVPWCALVFRPKRKAHADLCDKCQDHPIRPDPTPRPEGVFVRVGMMGDDPGSREARTVYYVRDCERCGETFLAPRANGVHTGCGNALRQRRARQRAHAT